MTTSIPQAIVPCRVRRQSVSPDRSQELYPSLFFFSSRRRHTRFDCDWSSRRVLFRSRGEVLNAVNLAPVRADVLPRLQPWVELAAKLGSLAGQIAAGGPAGGPVGGIDEIEVVVEGRSEERRVGKGGRGGGGGGRGVGR